MTTELTRLGSRDILGKTVTAFGTVENPLFLAKDVAEWIEHSNVTVMVQSVDTDEVVVLKMNETLVNQASDTSTKQCLGQVREYTFLTEGGLYEVLFLSRKPVAKEFKAGVKKLLHDLRTGKAVAKPTGLALVKEAMDFLISENELLKGTVSTQQTKIAADAPKVNFAETFQRSNVLCHFQRLANVLHNNGVKIGRNRLLQGFRDRNDVLRGEALFTQKALDRGIGQNVPTGSYEYNGITIVSSRAFLNYKGIAEVFDRYGLTQDQRHAVMKDLTAADEPLSPEVGGDFPEGYFEDAAA